MRRGRSRGAPGRGRSRASPRSRPCSPPARPIARSSAMAVTTRLRLDRIASSTRNAGLTHDEIVGDEITASEGYILAVRILEDKASYNTIEDPTGRMLALRPGHGPPGPVG